MRKGKAAVARMLLLLLLLLAGSNRGNASSTSASITKSASAATTTITVKPNIVTSGNTASSTVKPTTSETIPLSVASTLATKSAPSATTKETLQTTLGTTRPTSTGSTSKGTSVKPSSSPVTTQQTKATTAPRTPTVSIVVGPRGPSVTSSSDSPRTVAVTPSPSTQSSGSSSPIVLTASSRPVAPMSHRHSTTPEHGSSAVPLESATPAKEKSTPAPGVSIAITTTRPGHMPPKGAVPTTVTKPEGKKDTATTQPPSGVAPPTPDLSHETPGTTRVTVTAISPEHHVPSPASGINGTSFQAESKIVCEDTVPSKYPGIVLTFNESRPCKNIESSSLKERLMYELCRNVKSSFNQSQDDCTVRLASVADDPKKLAIIRVSVTTHSVDDELAESLAVKKGELEKLGLSNLTYGGKPMDLDTEDRFGMPLIITIVCMAASLLLVAAIYGCCHQRISRRKDQQRLTEELQTMENGYHDNPTLEVMETSAEMQEKKVNLNGELADSWIVPMDSLTKDDLEEEEDTHL